MPTMKPFRSRVLIFPLFSILLAGILLAGLRSAMVSADDPPERHILVLIDESGSTRGTPQLKPMDPDGRRIRFAEFLVRYLQTFFPQEAEIGITGFVSDTLTIVPMTAAELWTQADFAAIRPALDKLFLDQRGPGGREFTTRFSAVLQKASTSFADLNCVDTENQCVIVLFSDGLWVSAEAEELPKQLKLLNDNGIQLTLALLAGDLTTTEESMSDAIKARGGWAHVRDVWTLPDVANNTVISNSTTLPPHEVYEQIVEALKIAEPLRDLRPVEVTDTGVISVTIPPHTRLAQIRLVPDGPMQEAWSLAPDVVAGTQRWWLDPPAGVLQGELARIANQPDDGIAFYSFADSQYPVQFSAQAIPDKLLAGTPVQLLAWYTVNGQIITDTAKLRVDVNVEPGSVPLELKPSAAGLFTATWTASVGQAYTATFTPKLGTGQDLPPGVAPVKRRFLVVAAPEIALAVGKPVSQTTFYVIPVTVTVKNADSLLASVEPSLELISKGLSQTIPLTLAATLPDQTKEYTSQVQLLPNSDIGLRALLPAGRTRDGVAYARVATEKSVAIERSELSRMRPPWFYAALGVFLILLLIIAVLVVRNAKSDSKPQQRVFVENIQEGIAHRISRDDLAEMLRRSYSVNSEWSVFAYEFAEKLLSLDYGQGTTSQ